MTHIPDESDFEYYPMTEGLGFIGIGWLSSSCDYSKGDVPEDFFESLCSLLKNRWDPPITSAGVHRCEFCRFSGGPGTFHYKDFKLSSHSSSEIFVPYEGRVYVAPENIVHYIDCHEYCPSKEFQKAVIECPDMGSPAYLKQILDGGVREWMQRMKRK